MIVCDRTSDSATSRVTLKPLVEEQLGLRLESAKDPWKFSSSTTLKDQSPTGVAEIPLLPPQQHESDGGGEAESHEMIVLAQQCGQ